MSSDIKLSNSISKRCQSELSKTPVSPSHSLFETLQRCHIGHWQENIIQSVQYSVQDTPQPGLCLLLPSHFSLALCPMTCKTPNDRHVQGVILFHGPGSLNNFIFGLFFSPITPSTNPLIYSVFKIQLKSGSYSDPPITPNFNLFLYHLYLPPL